MYGDTLSYGSTYWLIVFFVFLLINLSIIFCIKLFFLLLG